jgi:hypothetical protein
VIHDPGSTLRQIKTPEVLADIVVLSPTSYEVSIYPNSQVDTYPGGLYGVNGNAARTCLFSSPTNDANVPVLHVTETAGTTVVTRIFDATGAGTWSLIVGDETELRQAGTLPNGDTWIDTTRSKTTVVASKVRDIYHAFPWGTEKVKSIVDPDGAALTTEWTFNEIPRQWVPHHWAKETKHYRPTLFLNGA